MDELLASNFRCFLGLPDVGVPRLSCVNALASGVRERDFAGFVGVVGGGAVDLFDDLVRFEEAGV